MKENWIYRKLEESIEKVKYTTKVQSSDYKGKGLYPIISQEDDMISGYWDNGSDVFKVNKPVVIFGDHTRTLKYIDFDFVLGADGVKILQPIDKLNAKFFLYYLKWCKIPSLGYSRHYKLLKEIQIPIPPLPVQERIVSELDLLSGIIEKKKEQLKEYEQLAQAIFYDMFGDPATNEKGWEVKRLSDVSLGNLSYGSGASAIPFNEHVRYIRITDINENGELNEDVVSPNVYDEKYLLNEGDILFARSGATVGKTYCHKNKYGKCIYAGYLIRLVPNNEIVEPYYVLGYTKTSYYIDFIQKAQNAVAQPNINAKQYGNFQICVPPLSLQKQFAEKIEAIEKQKVLIKQSIQETETLFNSRMDYYFD